jgi:L-aspartate semialdehyde sulfurtransferase ferredoxin
VPDEQCGLVSERMIALGAHVRLLDHGINLDESECVDCGACISICPREVFSFDAEWKLRLVEEKCILCGKCVDACPHRALTLPL